MTLLPPQKPQSAEPETDAPGLKLVQRRVMRLLGLVLVLALVFAPMFVAKTSLRHRILPMLLPKYPAKITTGNSILLWWSPVELGDVQFYDTDGEPMLFVEKITSEKTLSALLLDQIRVGGFQIHRPHLSIRVREGGSNLEEAAGWLLAPDEGSEGLDCEFQIREGVIEIVDAASDRKSELRKFDADVRLPLDPAEAITVRGAVEVQNASIDGKAGTIDFDVSYRTLTDEKTEAASDQGTLRLKTKDLRLGALSALWGRVGANANISGVVVSDLKAEWTQGEPGLSFKLNGGLNATGISLSLPAWLGQDTFQLDYLTHKGQIEYQNGEVHLTDVDFKSDVLTCQAKGILNLPRMVSAWNTPSAEVPLEEFHLAGEVNIAKIARMLPETLKLRQGLEIQTGKLLFALDAKAQNAEQQLTGSLSTSRIEAVADGQHILWDKPLELSLRLRNTQAGPVLDELLCRAEFLSLWAEGTPENATFKAACKLDSLMAELNRFADFKDWELAGRIDAGATIRRLSPDLARGAASAVIKDFRFNHQRTNPASPWEEKQLVFQAGGDLVTKPNELKQLQNLSLSVRSGSDELELTQTEPADWTGELSRLVLVAEIRGELSTWQNRLRPFVSTDSWPMQGTLIASAKADLSRTNVTVSRAIVDFQNLKLQSGNINLAESRVHIETQAEWTAETNTLRLPTTTWASRSLSLRADDVEYFTASDGLPRTSGRVVFRGGVAELSRWFSLENHLGPEMNLAGVASGQIDLSMTDKAADANWNLIVENASLIKTAFIEPPPGPGFRPTTNTALSQKVTVWNEDRVAFRGGGAYFFEQDLMQLRPTLLEAPWLYLTASGTLQELSTKGDANLTGSLTCNLPLLAERYRKQLGAAFQVAGNEPRSFSIRGPLWGASENQRVANELTTFVSLPWQKVSAYGIAIGPSELKADLTQGTVLLGPVDAALGTGRIKFNSKLPLNAPSLALQIGKGPILENIRLTPEVSRDVMKYALPLLADSTETEGQFSAMLTTDCVVPLENPAAINASGLLAIEFAQMRPGKLANSFLDVIKQLKTLLRGQPAGGVLPADLALLRMEKQSVTVQVANGRVYHQNLRMILADVPLTTTGSVGFDETLSLIAEIPIQPDWLAQNRLLAGLQNQTLKIPVTGTLSQPLLDTRAIFSALGQATQNATEKLLDDKLENQLNRLFKRQ